MADVTALKPAVPAYKQEILDLLEEIRAGVESGETIELVAIKIGIDNEYWVRSAGDLSMVRMAGYLSSAWLSAAMALREG
jgi:hypothetical protein